MRAADLQHGRLRYRFDEGEPVRPCSYFTTFPERMQRVQASRVCRAPFTVAFTRLRLGFQTRRVTLWA